MEPCLNLERVMLMKNYLQLRCWIETVSASFTGALFLITLVHRDWIETVFGVDPDHHNGSLEWLIVTGLLVATLVLASLARIEWKKARTAAAA